MCPSTGTLRVRLPRFGLPNSFPVRRFRVRFPMLASERDVLSSVKSRRLSYRREIHGVARQGLLSGGSPTSASGARWPRAAPLISPEPVWRGSKIEVRRAARRRAGVALHLRGFAVRSLPQIGLAACQAIGTLWLIARRTQGTLLGSSYGVHSKRSLGRPSVVSTAGRQLRSKDNWSKIGPN